MNYRRTIPRDPDPVFAAGVTDSFRSEFRRMLSFNVDLFPQAAGSPSVSPPPRALFEDFFAPSTVPPQPIFLSWFERVCAALADADSRMAAPSLRVVQITPFFLLVLPPTRLMGILRRVGQFLSTHRCCLCSSVP